MSEANGEVCLWCGKRFTPRRNGGKRQVFCRPACRRAFDAAGRRWVAKAISTGMLTLDVLRNGPAATRALLPRATSPAPISEAEEPAHIALTKPLDEAGDLLDDFLIALLDLPGVAWSDLAAALPDELCNRIDQYLKARLS